MQITRTADYALRAVVHLAENGGNRPVPASAIARMQDIPAEYVSKVLQSLSRAGLVTCRPGRGGGATLLREPQSISVLEVVEAVDGPLALNRCLIGPGQCERDTDCLLHDFWAQTQESLVRTLSDAKISRFCRAPQAP